MVPLHTSGPPESPWKRTDVWLITHLKARLYPQYFPPQPSNPLDTWWILPSKSLESYSPRLHTPSSGWWERFAIFCGRFSVAGWWRWPPGAGLLQCCYPPFPPSQLSGTYWLLAACQFSEESAARRRSYRLFHSAGTGVTLRNSHDLSFYV